MGIPSLNSAILYSLYFHLHRINIANIPNHVHKNSPFYGQQVHFSVPVHGNGRFYGREITIQSGHIKDISETASRQSDELEFRLF